jgi:hypothetical protein
MNSRPHSLGKKRGEMIAESNEYEDFPAGSQLDITTSTGRVSIDIFGKN